MQRTMVRIVAWLVCGIAMQAATWFAWAAENGKLVLGVYPYLSPSQTVKLYAPLAEHLAATLGHPVSLRSAPDFEQFIARTQAGEYDIIFTAPHMGRLAQRRDSYLPLARSGYSIVIVALARRDGPVRTLADLRGRTLGVGAKLSMTYQSMEQALAAQGLTLGRDVRRVTTASFSNVPETLLRGEIDAGATGTLLWENAPPAQREQLREIYRSAPLPGFLLLAHPRLDPASRAALAKALHGFADTPTGKQFFSATGQLDFRPVDADALKRIDPFTAVFDPPAGSGHE